MIVPLPVCLCPRRAVTFHLVFVSGLLLRPTSCITFAYQSIIKPQPRQGHHLGCRCCSCVYIGLCPPARLAVLKHTTRTGPFAWIALAYDALATQTELTILVKNMACFFTSLEKIKWWQSQLRHHFSNMMRWRVLPVFVECIAKTLVPKNIPHRNLSARAVPRVTGRAQLTMVPTFHISALKLHGISKSTSWALQILGWIFPLRGFSILASPKSQSTEWPHSPLLGKNKRPRVV